MIENGVMPAGPMEKKKNEMIIRDKDHPRSIVNLVPEAVQRAIMKLPDSMVDIGEPALRKILHERKVEITPLDERLRFMFWREYDTAQNNNRDMTMTNVYYGICSRDSFYLSLQNKERTAWMLCPPVDYEIATEEALIYGINQLRDILAMDHIGLMNKIDPKLAAVKLDIVKMLDARVKGAVIQTTRNLNVNVNQPKTQEAQAPSIGDVDKRIKELEQMINNLSGESKNHTIQDIEIHGVEVLGERDPAKA